MSDRFSSRSSLPDSSTAQDANSQSLWPLVTIDGGFVGIKKSWGKINNQELEPGLHVMVPWMNEVIHMDTRMKTHQVGADAASKDLQEISAVISIQHSLVGSQAAEVYGSIGDLKSIDSQIVGPAVQESVKAVTAQYTAEELVTKRARVKTEVTNAIKEDIEMALKSKNLGGAVQIANVAITDFKFSKEFNESIEAKVRAEQEALKAKNEKEKRITEAEASASEKTLAADAEAYKVDKESKSRAEAIRREGDALRENPELVRLRMIEKWNGMLPQVTGVEGMPFLQIPPLDYNKINGAQQKPLELPRK